MAGISTWAWRSMLGLADPPFGLAPQQDDLGAPPSRCDGVVIHIAFTGVFLLGRPRDIGATSRPPDKRHYQSTVNWEAGLRGSSSTAAWIVALTRTTRQLRCIRCAHGSSA